MTLEFGPSHAQHCGVTRGEPCDCNLNGNGSKKTLPEAISEGLGTFRDALKDAERERDQLRVALRQVRAILEGARKTENGRCVACSCLAILEGAAK